jgi:hypothetical protein
MKIKTILCMLLLSLYSIATTAQETTFTDPEKGFTFTVDGSNTATLTDYTGPGGAVTIPDTININGMKYSVTAIGDSAFKDHSGLTSVILSDSVTILGENAFRNCSGLTSVTIGDKVDSIGMFAFADCSSLTDVFVAWPTPLSITANVFYGLTLGSITLHVPTGQETVYRAANIWKQFHIPVTLNVTPETTDLLADGCTVGIEVIANVDWTVVSSENWAVITSASGRGNDTVTVTAQANDTGAQRTATITFRSASHTRTVTLTQAVPALNVTLETADLPANGGDTSFIITANVHWSVSSDAPWTLVNPVSGSSDSLVTISAAANPGSRRTATITVSGGSFERTITVTQPANDQDVLVDPIPRAADDKAGGQLTLRLNIPTNEAIRGSFRITLPLGLNLDPENTTLADNLVSSHERFISQIGNGVWQLVIRRRTALLNGTNSAMCDIVHIAWTEDHDLLPPVAAIYEIKITDLAITLGNQTIQRNEISVPVIAGGVTATETFESLKVWSHGGLLHVHTPQAEQIEIYALTGRLILKARKDVGPAVIHLTSLPRGILIVHGASGWTEKIVNN